MPYRICKTIELENAHVLTHHPDNCRFPHGHSRRVELILEADELDAAGMVCDFKTVRESLGDYLGTFDHALCMNTQDPMFETFKQAYGERIIGFANTDPTTEILAKLFFDECRKYLAGYAGKLGVPYPLRPSVRLVRVRVWETSSSWAEYGTS